MPNSQHWQDEANRMGGSALVALLSEISANQRALIEAVDELRKQDTAAATTIEKLLGGFPGADIEGHRRYHESVIEWRELRNKLVREALIKVSQAGALAGAGWLVLAMWKAFKISVMQ